MSKYRIVSCVCAYNVLDFLSLPDHTAADNRALLQPCAFISVTAESGRLATSLGNVRQHCLESEEYLLGNAVISTGTGFNQLFDHPTNISHSSMP